jgi:sugar O-acyltransferase (sialic acid O-acetyltransferase NeuD family)
MKKLLIFGAGGFAQEVFWTVQDINRARPAWDVIGFLDERPAKWRETYEGLPILDPSGEFPARCLVALGVGDPALKQRLAQFFLRRRTPIARLVHPSVVSGHGVSIGEGAVVQAGSVLAPHCFVGACATINIGCLIGHDASIGPYATVSPGARLSGNVSVGMGAYIGTGAAVREKVSIGIGSVVGMGAAAINNVPDDTQVVGVPAAFKRRLATDFSLLERTFSMTEGGAG